VFDATARRVVAQVVKHQAEVGITVLNDGEQSKISYATYVKDRLAGFEGTETVWPGGVGAWDFPEYAACRLPIAIRRPTCSGPIEWKDFSARPSGASRQKRNSTNTWQMTSPKATSLLFFLSKIRNSDRRLR
jgi:5-methyltetrahydropteroyltriglutamate--homocysteine methyltransferase